MQRTCKHGVIPYVYKLKSLMVTAECECFAFWGFSGGVTVWASFRIHLGQRSSF